MHPLAFGYQTLGRTARTLPRPGAYAAARQLMTAVYYAWPRGRNAARRNAEHLLPHVDWDGDADSLARAQFQRYGEYLVDAVRLDELTPADCYEAVGGDDPQHADQWEQLEEWYQRRPILFAVIHFGNWDILGGAFAHRIGPSMVLVDDLGHPALNSAIQNQRARLGMNPASRSSRPAPNHQSPEGQRNRRHPLRPTAETRRTDNHGVAVRPRSGNTERTPPNRCVNQSPGRPASCYSPGPRTSFQSAPEP